MFLFFLLILFSTEMYRRLQEYVLVCIALILLGTGGIALAASVLQCSVMKQKGSCWS